MSHYLSRMLLTKLAVDVGQLFQSVDIVIIHVGQVDAFAVAVGSQCLANYLCAFAHRSVLDQYLCHLCICL